MSEGELAIGRYEKHHAVRWKDVAVKKAVKQDGVSMLEARALKRTVTYICTTAEVRNALAYVFLKCQTRAMKFIQQQA
ncbi:unnamed protein product [Durusdinium trenchii]|uniref:Uncharacterized protein n=1 Tax=Durusdinium trenchii TaxID=1381693 RepID=A0ABP0N3D9_9DINO